MANLALLPTGTNSQSQTITQSPQAGAQSISTGAKANSVQPGTTTSLLNGSGSVSLHPTALPSISLTRTPPAPSATTATATVTPQPLKQQHHVNSIFLGFSVLLFVAAVVLVWAINRSAKIKT